MGIRIMGIFVGLGAIVTPFLGNFTYGLLAALGMFVMGVVFLSYGIGGGKLLAIITPFTITVKKKPPRR